MQRLTFVWLTVCLPKVLLVSGRIFSELYQTRSLLALPARMGELGLCDPSANDFELDSSLFVFSSLIQEILEQRNCCWCPVTG